MPKAIKSKRIYSKQSFSFTAPTATNVLIAGDFTNWERNPIPLKRETDGAWNTTVELDAGDHRYRFLVDGQWQDDPECTLRVPNPYGTEDMVRVVGGETPR